MAHQSRTPGRKIFRPHIHGAAACGGRAIITRRRLCIIGASIAHVGAKYFSPAHPWCGGELGAHHDLWCDDVLWLGEWILLAHVGAKNISPLQPWCVGVWRARHHNVWAIAHQSRTCGRKIFRPYKCGEWLHRVCAMICGAAMVMVGRLRINGARRGEKFFARPSVVRRRVAGAPPQCVCNCASTAHVGAKNISPVQMRRVVKFGVGHDLWCGDV